MTKPICMLTLLCVAIIVVLSACGSGGSASAPTATPAPAETQPTRTPRPSAAQSATVTPNTSEPTAAAGSEPTVTADSESERLPITTAESDLAALGSYQTTMRIEGTIQEEGQPEEPVLIIFQQLVLANGDRSLSIETNTADEGVSRINYLQIGNEIYQYTETSGEQTCFSMTDMEGLMGDMLRPESFIGDRSDARLVERGVNVNGFTTDRYVFSVSEQTGIYTGKVEGEIWVSASPAIVARHRGELSGQIQSSTDEDGTLLFGQLSNLRWQYDVERAPANAQITLPPKCEEQRSASADIPLPSNAGNMMRFGDFISFETTDPVNTVVTFFETEMKAGGWQAGEKTEFGGTVLLSFSKDGREVSISITPGDADNKTQVIITSQ